MYASNLQWINKLVKQSNKLDNRPVHLCAPAKYAKYAN